MTTSSPRQTPGLEIFQEVWGDTQCAYHSFAPGTDFTALLAPLPEGLCGVPHHAYIISGSMTVIYKDGSTDECRAGDVCYWPAPHNFISEEGAEIIQFSGSWRPGCAGRGHRGAYGQAGTGVAVGAVGRPAVVSVRPLCSSGACPEWEAPPRLG